jgi:amino acid transporter
MPLPADGDSLGFPDALADDSEFDDRHYPGYSPTRGDPLKFLPLAGLIFIYCSGGPFTHGEVLSVGGARWAFIGTLLMPWVYALPLALITCEQATRFPFCGGCVPWGFSLGRTVGHLNGILRFLTNLFDNPIYPVLATDYLGQAIPELVQHLMFRTAVYFVIMLLALFLNLTGIRAVSAFALLATVFVTVPFVLFFLLATPNMTPSVVFAPARDGPPDAAALISALYWQYSGVDTIAAFAADVTRTRAFLPRSYLATGIVVAVMYVLTGVASATITDDPELFAGSDFGAMSRQLPACEGGWLATWIRVAACLSSVATFVAAIALTSREFYAAALFGSFPLSALVRVPAKALTGVNAPVWAILLMTAFTIPFCYFTWQWLEEWSGILTVTQVLVQCAAFVAMRFPARIDAMIDARSECRAEECGMEGGGDENQVFEIPGGWVGEVVVLAPLIAVSAFLIYDTGWLAIVIMGAMLAGVALLKGAEIGGLALLAKWSAMRP